MKKIITLIMAFTLFICNFNTIYAQPVTNTEEATEETTEEPTKEPSYSSTWSQNFPPVNSEAAIIMEAETGSILYGKNINETYYPASITKILTTLIALENSSMNELVTFSRDAVFNVELDSSRIGIDVGEQLTMEQALYGIMLESANEVSYAVAEHIGGDIPSFSKLMNEKAKSLGALNSNFVNPHGLPDPNHYTTTYDMALISRAAIQNEDFKDITQTRAYIIPPTNIQEETRYLNNHHRFIKDPSQYEGAIGGKTGWTTLSRYTLVTFAKKNDMTLIAVVMNCPTITDQYEDTANLLDFAFENFTLYDVDNASSNTHNMDFFTKYYSFFNVSNSPLRVCENGKIVLPDNININDAVKDIKLVPLNELITGDNRIGSIVYSYNNNELGKTDIIYNNTDSNNLFNSLYINPANIKPEDLNTPPQVDNAEQADSKTSYIPIVIGVTVGLIILLIGFRLIYNSKAVRRRRKKRKRRK